MSARAFAKREKNKKQHIGGFLRGKRHLHIIAVIMQVISRQNVIQRLTRPEKVTGLYLWHKRSGTYQDLIEAGNRSHRR